MFNEALEQEMHMILRPQQTPGSNACLTPWGHYHAKMWAPTPSHFTLVRTYISDTSMEEAPRKGLSLRHPAP